MKAIDVSKYIVAQSDSVGDLITNKKLQKLLYYVKAWGLVYFSDGGVIEDDFEAWIHGPVCNSVYQEYKRFGYGPIRLEYANGISSSQFMENFREQYGKCQTEKNKIEMIDVVFQKYAPLTSLQLELLTHSEEPWKEARKGLRPIDNSNNVIKEETMKTFYSKKDE